MSILLCEIGNIKSMNITTEDGLFEGIITLKVHNVAFLKELTKKLEKVESITSITRTYTICDISTKYDRFNTSWNNNN